MIIAIIILSVLLVGAAAFIFCLWMLLKNTLNIVEKAPAAEAYNGTYLPATVISKIVFSAPSDGYSFDFTAYEKYKVVYHELYMKQSKEDYIEELVEELVRRGELEEEARAVAALKCETPYIILKNCLVYETREGVWTWKSQN